MVQEMSQMEGSVARRRYARRPYRAGGRKRQYGQEKKSLGEIILRQGIICAVLLLIALLARFVDIPATRFIAGQVKHVLSRNIELGELIKSVEKTIGGLGKKLLAENENQEPEEGISSTAQTSSQAQTLSGTLASGDDGAKTVEEADDYGSISDDTVETSVLGASTAEGKKHESGMIPPVEGVISSLFGENTNEITGISKPHNGIDISVTGLGAVKAVLDGKVSETGVSPNYGKYVRILHADGLQTVYANCSDIMVDKGDIVKQSDEIAWIGDENLSVGTHLHFEVWKDGKAVDPLEYIDVTPR